MHLGVIRYMAQFCIWITRWLLWALMMFGHGISCFMLRQMEYNADSYKILLAGSDGFTSTAKRLYTLSVAHQMAMQSLGDSLEEGRLVDDVPALVIASERHINPEELEKSYRHTW